MPPSPPERPRRPIQREVGPLGLNRPVAGAAPALGRLLADPDTFGSVLLVLAVDLLGSREVSTWDLEAIARELEDAAAGVRCTASGAHRLGASLTAWTTDLFWNDVTVFVDVCNALYDGVGPDGTVDPADLEECAWGVTEVSLIQPPDDPAQPASEEIRRYLAGVLEAEGLAEPPRVLRWVLGDDGAGRLDRALSGLEADAALVAASYDQQRGGAEWIDDLVRRRWTLLQRQLQALPLRHGTPPGDLRDAL